PVEAMSYSKPVVAVNNGGPKESIVSEESGFLCESRSEEFASKIFLLYSDINLRRVMGSNARARMVEKFSMNTFANDLTKACEGLIRPSKRFSLFTIALYSAAFVMLLSLLLRISI